MTTTLTRRTVISAALAAAGAASLPLAASAEEKQFPRIPSDWDPDALWAYLEEKSVGIRFAGPEGRPRAYILFDTQCQWCMKLLARTTPLNDRIEFVWVPLAGLNVHSEPQASTILQAADPAAKLLEHEEHFRDADFKGIRYNLDELKEETRKAVWLNQRFFRRTACRLIPTGIAKDAAGKFHFIDSRSTEEELKAIFGIS